MKKTISGAIVALISFGMMIWSCRMLNDRNAAYMTVTFMIFCLGWLCGVIAVLEETKLVERIANMFAEKGGRHE